MIRIPVPLLPIACLAFLTACEFLAGGGTDQPNELRWSVVGGEGAPARGARILLREGNFRPDTNQALAWNPARVLDSTRSDSLGGFSLACPASPAFLEALGKDGRSVAIGPCPQGRTRDTLRLVQAARLDGWLRDGTGLVHSLVLTGTHYEARLGENGSFRFDRIQPGRYRLLARSSQSGRPSFLLKDSLVLSAGDSLHLDSLSLPPDSLVLFDFEAERVRSLLRGILYPLDDWKSGQVLVNNTPLDTLPVGNPAAQAALIETGAYRGRSLRLHLAAGRNFRFEVGKSYHDFSRVREVSFYARSAGDSLTLRVGFATEAILTGEGSFVATVRVDSAWRKVVIRPVDILPESGSKPNLLTWSDVRNRVARIAVSAGRNDTLWMDDLQVNGVDYGDLAVTPGP